MAPNEFETRAMGDPEAQLERNLIEEFLRSRGLDWHALHALPEDQATRVLKEASMYAASKLAEVEARAHYVHELHGDAEKR